MKAEEEIDSIEFSDEELEQIVAILEQYLDEDGNFDNESFEKDFVVL